MLSSDLKSHNNVSSLFSFQSKTTYLLPLSLKRKSLYDILNLVLTDLTGNEWMVQYMLQHKQRGVRFGPVRPDVHRSSSRQENHTPTFFSAKIKQDKIVRVFRQLQDAPWQTFNCYQSSTSSTGLKQKKEDTVNVPPRRLMSWPMSLYTAASSSSFALSPSRKTRNNRRYFHFSTALQHLFVF